MTQKEDEDDGAERLEKMQQVDSSIQGAISALGLTKPERQS